MDILNDEGNNFYLKFISREKVFKLGDDAINFKYMQVDLNTLQTGWGRFENGYEFQWDSVAGSKTPQPAAEGKQFTRAFSVWVMVDGIEDQPLLWHRNSVNEYQTFVQMLKDSYEQWTQDKNQLPYFEFTGSEEVQGKMQPFNRATLPLRGFADRKPAFIIPDITAPVADDAKESAQVQEINAAVDQAKEDFGGDTNPFAPNKLPF